MAISGARVIVALLALLAPPAGALQGQVLQLPYHQQQEGNWCGAAVAQAVMEYYGVKKAQSRIAGELGLRRDGGNLAAVDLLHYLRGQGFSVVPHQSDNDTLSMRLLEEYLEEGIPVIVLQRRSLESSEGHYRVVVGMTPGRVVALDPLVGLLFVPREDFLRLWEANAATMRDNQMLAVWRP
ncbi:MAG: hypothetical protein GXO66_01840 [Euryarchaeota archaeon]|nr:hypothetical protein [Euryarchaeota archaeon]